MATFLNIEKLVILVAYNNWSLENYLFSDASTEVTISARTLSKVLINSAIGIDLMGAVDSFV